MFDMGKILLALVALHLAAEPRNDDFPFEVCNTAQHFKGMPIINSFKLEKKNPEQ